MATKSLAHFCLLITFFLITGLAQAQQPVKVPRIGYLSAASGAEVSFRAEPFRQGLRELGYVEGTSIEIDYKYAEGKLEFLPSLASELVRLKVDVIVTAGPSATRPAKSATTSIPIVMTQDSDPVANGFVASLARPGQNFAFTSLHFGMFFANMRPTFIGQINLVPRQIRYRAKHLGQLITRSSAHLTATGAWTGKRFTDSLRRSTNPRLNLHPSIGAS